MKAFSVSAHENAFIKKSIVGLFFSSITMALGKNPGRKKDGGSSHDK